MCQVYFAAVFRKELHVKVFVGSILINCPKSYKLFDHNLNHFLINIVSNCFICFLLRELVHEQD
jgi:hypothetical protein